MDSEETKKRQHLVDEFPILVARRANILHTQKKHSGKFEDCKDCLQWKKQKENWFKWHLDYFVENPISYLSTTDAKEFLDIVVAMDEGLKKAREIANMPDQCLLIKE